MDFFEETYNRIAQRIMPFSSELKALTGEIKRGTSDFHLILGQPPSVCGNRGVYFLAGNGRVVTRPEKTSLICSREHMQEVFLQVCAHSVFSHEEEMRGGYIQVDSFCRVGIAGTAVLEKGELKTVRDITSMVFRIPREIVGCGDKLIPLAEGGLLLVGPPSSGKTTLLRDLVQGLSFGRQQSCKRIAVLDEKGELGGSFNLGPCADVLRGYPKAQGFDVAIRMLSPEILVCDEIGERDLTVVEKSIFSGVPLVASVHGTECDLLKRPLCRKLLACGAFSTIAFLYGRQRPGEIQSIQKMGDVYEALGYGTAYSQRAFRRGNVGGKTSKTGTGSLGVKAYGTAF